VISAVSAWIKQIILVVFFATFLELLLPSSSMQKFIRMIVGLFIMLAILNPLIGIIQNRNEPGQVPAVSSNIGNSSAIVDMTNTVVSERKQLSIELYKKELAQQIRALVLAVEGVADAVVSIDIDSDNFLKKGNVIKSIVVYVQPGVTAPGTQIARVSIGRENPGRTDAEALRPQIKQKIQNSVSELLQVPREKIEVRPLHQP
jgi:stage III sporulation protein AF